MCISAMRIISLSFIFVLPVAWGFSLLARESAGMIWTVWTTFIIAEILSCFVATLFMKRINRKTISTLK